MIDDSAIIPECYVDTNLTETLVPPARRGHQHGYNHQKGCTTVAKKMRENFAGGFALGIIDKDRRDIDYLKEFEEIDRRGALILHRHRNHPACHHYIIQISPALERFILSNASHAGVRLEDYNLPSDFERLKYVAKKKNTKDDPSFKALFRAIHHARTPEFQTLACWISHLKEHPYDASLDYLRSC